MNNDNLNPTTKGEIRNPNGRPKKLLTDITSELKDAGYKRVSPSEITEILEILFNLDKDEIESKVKDNKSPMVLRIIGKAMLSNKGFEVIEKLLDRAHGKVSQKTENLNTNINVETSQNSNPDELLKEIENYKRVLTKN